MGRVRPNMRRLESSSNRQVTYCKRRAGILKKAKEISVLCEIDILLLMFSPTGKQTLFQGERRLLYCLLVTVLYLRQVPKFLASCTGHAKVKLIDALIFKYLDYSFPNLHVFSNFDEIIAKFAQLTPQERAKRKMESLEMLRKIFKKLDHDVGMQEFLDVSVASVEELHNQVKVLQSRLTDVEKETRMECELRDSLNAVHVRKLQSMMHWNLPMGSRQDEQTLTCHPANNSQNMPFPVAPNFPTQGGIGYSGDTSVAECSHVLNTGKELELERTRQTTAILDDTVWDDLNSIACLRQQLSEPYSYYPYDDLNLLERKSLDPQSEVDLREYLMDYETQRNFNLHRSVDSVNNSWDCAAGTSTAPILDEKSYPQQGNCSRD